MATTVVVSCGGDDGSTKPGAPSLDAGIDGSVDGPGGGANGGSGGASATGGRAAETGGAASTGGAPAGGGISNGDGGPSAGGADAGDPDGSAGAAEAGSDASSGAGGADAGDSDGGVTSGGSPGTGGAASGGTGGGASGGTGSGGAPTVPLDLCKGTGGGPPTNDPMAGLPSSGPGECPCQNGDLCFDGPGSQKLTCRTPCDPDGGVGGKQGTCGAGEVCTNKYVVQEFACMKECTPYATPSGCGTGEWCYPTPHVSWTQGIQVPGLCIAGNNLTIDQPCLGGGCAVDLLCRSPSTTYLYAPYCSPICDPQAAPGGPGSCTGGRTCRSEAQGRGGCVVLCDVFGTGSECPLGEECSPFYENLGAGAILEGHCVRPGVLTEGQRCVQGACGPGLVCTPDPPPYSFEAATCRKVCDPANPSTCGAGACVPLLGNGADLSLGACTRECTPWVKDACAAGCKNGEWCSPTYSSAVDGVCVAPTNLAAIGESCSNSGNCAPGGFCACVNGPDEGGFCRGSRRCERVCDPDATTGAGACPGSQVCTAVPYLGAASKVGICRNRCDHDANTPCPSSAETCVAGELLPHGDDTCYDIRTPLPDLGRSCSIVDFAPNDPCGGVALCLGTIALRCENVCRTSVAPIGTTGHPDCVAATDTCEELADGLPYGICRE